MGLSYFCLRTRLCALALVACTGTVCAAQTVHLPDWACAHPDSIFVGAFEPGEAMVPSDPSLGSGGATAVNGNVARTVSVAGDGDHTYYLHLPTGYTPTRAWPLLLALEGAAGSRILALSEAQTVRSDWSALADASGFVVAVPVASGSQGGWTEPNPDGSGPSDYDVIAAVLADVASAYNVERTREYAWGYSAGGEVLYDIVLTGWDGLDANSFAGFAVTGAVIAGCPTYSIVASCIPASAARHIPLDIHAGTNDSNIPISYPRSDESAFMSAGWDLGSTLFYTEFSDGNPPGGHTYTTGHLQQVWQSVFTLKKRKDFGRG